MSNYFRKRGYITICNFNRHLLTILDITVYRNRQLGELDRRYELSYRDVTHLDKKVKKIMIIREGGKNIVVHFNNPSKIVDDLVYVCDLGYVHQTFYPVTLSEMDDIKKNIDGLKYVMDRMELKQIIKNMEFDKDKKLYTHHKFRELCVVYDLIF